MLPLDLLLQKRQILKAKKSFFSFDKNLDLKKLRSIIKNQISLNNNILFTAEGVDKGEKVVGEIRKALLKHNLLLQRQLAIVDSHLARDESKHLLPLLEEEGRLSAELSRHLEEKNRELYGLLAASRRREYLSIRASVLSLRKNIFELRRSLGDRAKVTKYGNLVLKNIEKIQETDVYDFMRDDLEKIKHRVRKVVRNPKDAKWWEILGSFYFFLPGSFEMTSAFLLLRYGRHYIRKRRKNI